MLIGTSIEELIRHHPSLKIPVFGAIKTTLARIQEMGNAYEPQESIKAWYRLSVQTAASISSQAGPDGDIAMESADSNTSQQSRAVPVESEPNASVETFPFSRDENATRAHDNLIISFIDVFCKVRRQCADEMHITDRTLQFLEGFFQHAPHCKDFVSDSSALALLGNLTSLPCLPYDFSTSVASDSLVQVVRTMAESATTETLNFLLSLVQETLSENADFWESIQEESRLLPLVDFKG